VSITGNDANSCTQSLPCKTIKKGMSVAQIGDTVIVSAGVYHEYVYVDKSITLISNGATIDGVNTTGAYDGLVSIVASNVKFQGFTISNAKMYGLANFGNNNQITSNIIHNTQGAGIWMRDGNFNIFDGNEVYNTVLKNSAGFDGTYYTCSPTATAWSSAINSWGGANSNTWRNNNIHDNCGEGIVTIVKDLIENNTFKNNWSIEIYIANSGAVVRNNTIINTKPYIVHGSDESWRAVPAGIGIGDEYSCLSDNNTITGNNITGLRYGIAFYQYISCSGVKNTLIESNTIINAWDYGLRILSGAHTNSIIKNNTIQLSSGKPLTIQNGGFTVIGNTFSSNTNVFEWNGKSYDFTGWNNVVPGNFWRTAGEVLATYTPSPTTQAPPSTSTSVTVSLAPVGVIVGTSSTGTASLNLIPDGGFASVEFTCAYNSTIVEVSNITITGLFGTDPVTVVNGPLNGSFIVAIAGSKGNKALTDGAAFTFSARGLQVGQSAITCQTRVSTGDHVLVTIPSTPANLNVTSAPLQTATVEVTSEAPQPGMFAGQVLASKTVSVTLNDPNNSVAGSVIANVDGTFSIPISSGSYTVSASALGYLDAQGTVNIASGTTATFQPISLLAGDIDGNNVIDQFDALTIGINYNGIAPDAADLNSDGVINIIDMEIMAPNYRQTGPFTWQ